ncbi:MAG: hypothetical protein ACJ75Z_03375 [Solirubrobacterales bacterium]
MRRSRLGFRTKLAAVGVAVCALALALTALPASGHKVTYDSHLQLKIDTLSDTTDTFSGKVISTRAACEFGRIIYVTHAGVTIATATTDAAGNWTVTGPRPPKNDDVTAFTPKKILKKSRRHRHRCARAVSTHKAP